MLTSRPVPAHTRRLPGRLALPVQPDLVSTAVSAGVPERPAFEIRERGAVAPLAPLEQLHDGPPSRTAVQVHVVDARPHDRQAPAGLGDLRDVAGPAPAAEQAGRTHRRAPDAATPAPLPQPPRYG